MRENRFKDRLMSWLPVKYDWPYGRLSKQNLFISFALQRSGQHLVIDWVCRGLVDAMHLNHCRFYLRERSATLTPMAGRRVIYSEGIVIDDSSIQGRQAYRASLPDVTPPNLLYSLEDIRLSNPATNKLLRHCPAFQIVILRDPANWLASSIVHGRHTQSELKMHMNILKQYLRYATHLNLNPEPNHLAVNYNLFIQDKEYRVAIAKILSLSNFENAERALHRTPDFGGGSSFKDKPTTSTDPQTRWLEFRDDPFFQSVMQDRELLDLSQSFFGVLPGQPVTRQQ